MMLVPIIIALWLAIRTVYAWAGMLLLGVAHSFDSTIPALGFYTVFFLSLALAFIVPHSNDINIKEK